MNAIEESLKTILEESEKIRKACGEILKEIEQIEKDHKTTQKTRLDADRDG